MLFQNTFEKKLSYWPGIKPTGNKVQWTSVVTPHALWEPAPSLVDICCCRKHAENMLETMKWVALSK